MKYEIIRKRSCKPEEMSKSEWLRSKIDKAKTPNMPGLLRQAQKEPSHE